jgi:hypothetical protein
VAGWAFRLCWQMTLTVESGKIRACFAPFKRQNTLAFGAYGLRFYSFFHSPAKSFMVARSFPLEDVDPNAVPVNYVIQYTTIVEKRLFLRLVGCAHDFCRSLAEASSLLLCHYAHPACQLLYRSLSHLQSVNLPCCQLQWQLPHHSTPVEQEMLQRNESERFS